MAEIPGTIVDDPKRPWKAVVPLVFAVLYAAIQAGQIALGDGSWDSDDTTAVIISVLTAVGVYLKANPKTFATGRANGL